VAEHEQDGGDDDPAVGREVGEEKTLGKVPRKALTRYSTTNAPRISAASGRRGIARRVANTIAAAMTARAARCSAENWRIAAKDPPNRLWSTSATVHEGREMKLGKLLVMAGVALACVPASARAQAVVSLGDSAISGEAGRWAGNTNGSSSRTDATGPATYYDNANHTAETTPGCHRSISAEVHIGGVPDKNLACSGARTYTHTGDDGAFKPGLDFYNSGGQIGQALALQRYAATQNVKAVVVLIGANDYGFADIVQACVLDWLTSPSWWKNYCQDDSSIKSIFSASNVATVTANVKQAFLNVRQAMRNDNYADSSYRILIQTYSSPLPNGSGIRYPETGFTRQSTGGCGVWNSDANWSNNTVVATFNSTIRNALAQSGLTNASLLEMQNALVGRRLCENTVGLLEERGIANWQSPGAVDKTEWVEQIRTLTTLFPPYQMQEDGHPNYWGQLALRNCFRQAYDGGAPHGGVCARGNGLDPMTHEPRMTLQ
jgi:hypothetical protein